MGSTYSCQLASSLLAHCRACPAGGTLAHAAGSLGILDTQSDLDEAKPSFVAPLPLDEAGRNATEALLPSQDASEDPALHALCVLINRLLDVPMSGAAAAGPRPRVLMQAADLLCGRHPPQALSQRLARCGPWHACSSGMCMCCMLSQALVRCSLLPALSDRHLPGPGAAAGTAKLPAFGSRMAAARRRVCRSRCISGRRPLPSLRAKLPMLRRAACKLQDESPAGAARALHAEPGAGVSARCCAGVSLVNAECQRFCAMAGRERFSMPRDVSLCSWTIQTPHPEVLIVEDMATDGRWAADSCTFIGHWRVRCAPVIGHHSMRCACAVCWWQRQGLLWLSGCLWSRR